MTAPDAHANLNVSSLTPTQGVAIPINVPTYYGNDFDVAGIGDFNGDGFEDLAIGVPNYTDSDYTYAQGAAYVLFGGANGEFEADLSALDGSNGFKFVGESEYDYVGHRLASAGDVNGDGLSDLVIGRPSNLNGSSSLSGSAYVIFGTSSPQATLAPSDITAASGGIGLVIEGGPAGGTVGASVDGGGDINGDGFSDLIVGAPYVNSPAYAAGASYVVFGNETFDAANIDLTTIDGTDGFSIEATGGYERLGHAVSFIGDINNDGIDDFAVGAPSTLSTEPGAAYVVFGSQSGWAASFSLQAEIVDGDGSQGFKAVGEANDDRLGAAVSAAGDVNGDGVSDLLLSADEADFSNRADAGRSYVVFGTAAPFSPSLDLNNIGSGIAGFRLYGESSADGYLVQGAAAGDVNGDGIDDLSIGSPDADDNFSIDIGKGHVIFGDAQLGNADIDLASIDGTNGLEVIGAFDYSGLGAAVSGAGDINGDGFADILVGAPYDGAGKAYVLFGGLTGFGEVPSLTSSVSTLDFEKVPVATASNLKSITLTNTGTGPLSLGTLSLTGADASDFALSSDNCSNQTLAVSASCTLSVSLTPAQVGARTAAVSVPSNASTSPDSIGLVGTGVLLGEVALSSTRLDFGQVVVGQDKTELVSLSNKGAGQLAIEPLAINGSGASDYALTNDGCSGQTLRAAGQCEFSVVLTPSSNGPRSASLSISTNALSSPDSVALAGLGHQLGALSVSTGSVDFGLVAPNQTSTQAVTITNQGLGDLVLGQMALAGTDSSAFGIASDGCSGQALSPEATCELVLEVTQPGSRPVEATLTIPSDNGTEVVSLTAQPLETSSAPRASTIAERDKPVPVIALQPQWLALLVGLLGWLGVRARG
ncbi:MAG: choice-of-anchor D domain-containing protein [Wenzhouxiangella sp.]|nr:choice-of-anchor D domain-containing protein [Wenzhouxiangella sp.]